VHQRGGNSPTCRQEQGAAEGALEGAGVAPVRAGEGAALVPNSSLATSPGESVPQSTVTNGFRPRALWS